MKDKIKVSLIDDHKLFRKGMVELINGFESYQVHIEASNGLEFKSALNLSIHPDIALLDINMPEMDGFETATFLTEKYPGIKILALSMYDDEKSIIKMIKAGARGYILKDSDPSELKKAFDDLMTKGYYHSDLVSTFLVTRLHQNETPHYKISDREMEFLKLACSELTYKEIADIMCLAPRTIDGYRESLFEKLNVKSRVGLVLFAVKSEMVSVNKQ